MIISDTEKFIFIHNPKCAGTTVRTTLSRYDSRNNFYWMYDRFNGMDIDKAHLPLHILEKYAPSDFKLMDEYFVFGFVRHPLERFISSFNEMVPHIYQAYIRGQLPRAGYIDFVNQCANFISADCVDGPKIHFRHFVRQLDMFYIHGAKKADLILKVEDAASAREALQPFSPLLADISPRWAARQNVKPTHLSWREILSPQNQQRVRSLYASDFEVFGYLDRE